ncbi:hypothetical protein PBY51_023297 [Eleginops maclovinus]|uniref:Uncharacterized protein n=1 Tax=Eleginops maclovinus TaxID=56733 RepID=A0AAN7X2P9_ELEMC|nr:hypothetical protein PBY51_023297 [Eleginops maclovinus]
MCKPLLPPCCAPSASAAITSRESAHSYLLIIPEPGPGPGQSTHSSFLPETALWRLGRKIDKEVEGRWRETQLDESREASGREISLLQDAPLRLKGKGEKAGGIRRGRDGGEQTETD